MRYLKTDVKKARISSFQHAVHIAVKRSVVAVGGAENNVVIGSPAMFARAAASFLIRVIMPPNMVYLRYY